MAPALRDVIVPSSFTSPTPGSAIWREGARECRATGRAVLSDLRVGLLWERFSDPGVDETLETQNAIDSAGAVGWSTATLASLAALLTRYSHAAFASAVRGDAARGGALSPASMQAVLWAAYGNTGRARTTSASGETTYANRHEGSPASFSFPADTQLPVVGSRAPMPLDGIVAGTSCAAAPAPGRETGDITTRGVAETSPWLVLFMIGAAAVTGLTLMTFARKRSEHW